jgi:hypothetical protein
MSGVVSVSLLTARRDDGRAADRHPFAVGAAPVTVDRIGERRMCKSKKRGTHRSGY